MIKVISTSISKYLGNYNSSLSLTDLLKIEYTIEVILGELTKLTIIFLIFLCLNQLPLFLLFYTFLFTTRTLAGGIHCKTFYSCLIVSILYFTVVILLSILLPKFNTYFYMVFFIVSFAIVYKYAPCVNKKRPIKNKKRLKILSLISLTFWTTLFFKLPNVEVSNCIFVGTLIQISQLIILNMKGVVYNGKIYKYFFSNAA